MAQQGGGGGRGKGGGSTRHLSMWPLIDSWIRRRVCRWFSTMSTLPQEFLALFSGFSPATKPTFQILVRSGVGNHSVDMPLQIIIYCL